jgi:hypothetical protein
VVIVHTLTVVVDITVVFNATTKSLIITTAPWTSTWSYDPDFNVLVGANQDSGDDFPLAAVAGGSVGGNWAFLPLVCECALLLQTRTQ